jgi:hypothetical protein
MNRARRLLCGGAVPALLATGCLIPYAYPKLDYVPGTDLGPKAPDVHAFRVDVTARQVDIGETGTFTLTEIEPRADGSFPAQTRFSLERGVYLATVPLGFNVGRRHATRVRLYRPGYQVVEVPAWGSAAGARWVPAADWLAQERAVDDLLHRPTVSAGAGAFARAGSSSWDGQLPEVGAPQTARVLVFAAAEYERVALLAPTPEDAACLREKAGRLVETRPAATRPDGSAPRPPAESP